MGGGGAWGPLWAHGLSVLPTPDCTTHLGIERYDDRPMHDAFIYARINLARRAAYSLMGVGFHGLNGLSPKVSRHIYMTFVIPILLYGLEAITMSKKTLKQIQSLPERTADAAVYQLIGIPPIEALIDIRISTFAASLALDSAITREVMLEQLALKDDSSSSWFTFAQKRLRKYHLPDWSTLVIDMWSKLDWNRLSKITILNHCAFELSVCAATKSTLNLMNYEFVSTKPFKKPHPIWRHVHPNTRDVGRATIKARLLSGTYILQTNVSTVIGIEQ